MARRPQLLLPIPESTSLPYHRTPSVPNRLLSACGVPVVKLKRSRPFSHPQSGPAAPALIRIVKALLFAFCRRVLGRLISPPPHTALTPKLSFSSRVTGLLRLLVPCFLHDRPLELGSCANLRLHPSASASAFCLLPSAPSPGEDATARKRQIKLATLHPVASTSRQLTIALGTPASPWVASHPSCR